MENIINTDVNSHVVSNNTSNSTSNNTINKKQYFKNYLLLFMSFCYTIPIYLICYNYKKNNCISNIINDDCKNYVLIFMVMFGGGLCIMN